MICVMGYQVVIPATRVFALTSGPSQPEVQSFEPVGTTEMVDLFSGDFVYNIPLMDVDGYPINIAYHSGINIEQEASWVGLGWNINPGEINRGVRGVPDDFNGDTLSKFLKIKNEKDYRLRLGVNMGFEFLGGINLGVSAGQFISYNNYKGVGVGMDVGASFSTPIVSAGIGMAVGSQEGASVDANAGLTFKTSNTEGTSSGSISVSGSTGFNTRTGLKNLSYNVNVGVSNTQTRTHTEKVDGEEVKETGQVRSNGGIGFGSSIPIGLQNYVAVTTNASVFQAFSLQLKFGVEAMYMYPHANTTMNYSELSHDKNGSLPSYGYLFSQNAQEKGVMDFSREKDGVYNTTLPNLPLSSMTYDVYNINGQGTGGMFRPFRNDIGTVYDPLVTSKSSSKSFSFEVGVGVGPVGGLFEFGTDVSLYKSRVESGPWYKKPFRSNIVASLFENVYFKQGGELTSSQQQTVAPLASHDPVYLNASNNLINKAGNSVGQLPNIYGTFDNRSPRSNFLSFISNNDAAIKDVTFNTKIENYPNNGFLNNNTTIKLRDRSGTKANKAKGHQIAEMTQVLADGRRYVYGLPAMNNLQKEATFSVDGSRKNVASGLVKFTPGAEDGFTNSQGRENYFQATYTPAYAHSYLLTSVLSSDYTDITGDGISDDDLGSYTKFNYSLVDSDYRWIAPYQAKPGMDSVQYAPGFWSDDKDDKGHYIIGSKELWYMHSIETKNCIAEFYTSPRLDGMGVQGTVANASDFSGAGANANNIDGLFKGPKPTSSLSYKLDSIKLFNKHDRFVNQNTAIPIKTVIFDYDYSLCQKVPNNINLNNLNAPDSLKGKLTLKRIYFRYGNSQKSLLNPYVFNYDQANPNTNIGYNFSAKDRWGNYKRIDTNLTNYEFPYVTQNADSANANASNWHLKEIKLPSGGRLKINYEADDYSYVQDKRTMEMFRIAGVGASSNYDPRDVLYENIDRPYDYIYFKRDTTREISGKTMRENYLEGTDMLYFSFDVDIAARNRYEHINGYAKVEDVGICDNTAYGFIKVKRENAGNNSGKSLNPITLAGLNTGRYYLPHIIYPGYTDGDVSAMEVLKGLVGATKEMLTIWQNANVRFVKNGLAKKFHINKSWVRLHTPGYTKLGGGTRVSKLTLEDSWDQMAPNGAEASYGRTYDYTTLKDNKYEISSGVASYEPMVGADENPFRNPVKYTADAGRLLPAIDFYQEEPFGESFFPAPSVGYSKVTVRSINKEAGASSKGQDVHEFYTAKDFPVEVDFTEKNTAIALKHRGLINKEEHLRVLQGYALRLNDMHGKPKGESNYVVKKDGGTGEENLELITSTKYNYNVDGQGKLNNRVKAVKRGNLVQPEYSIPAEGVVIGEEVDFTIDSRRREMQSSSTVVNFNLNVVNFLFVVIPIPTIFFPDTNEESLFETLVTTKIIQQYGILKSVEHIDHGAKTTTENVLFDSETGQVLLTKVNNEFDEPVHNLNYPAYWAYDNMGSSYFNVGLEEAIDSVKIDNQSRGHLFGVNNKRYYNMGDELLMTYQDGNTTNNIRVWVTSVGVYYNGGPIPIESDPGACNLIIEPRAKTPTGYPTSPWFMNGTVLQGVKVKVLRSGRKNMLNSTVQQTVINGDFPVNSFNDLFNSTKFGYGGSGTSSVLSTGVTTFREDALNNEFTSSGNGGTYGYNAYIRGEKGNPRESMSFVWSMPRNYDGNHARKDGAFKTFAQFWSQGMLGGSCTLDDYNITTQGNSNPGWKRTREVTAYNAYGLPIEEKDAAEIPSTVLYGNLFTLPLAVASNARNKQVKYLGFEDLMQMQHENRTKLGIFPTLPLGNVAYGTPATFFYNYGKTYYLPYAGEYVANATVTSAVSHTGLYSLLFSGAGTVNIAKVSDFNNVPYCYVSLWAKTTSGDPAAGSIRIRATGKDANQNPISQDFTMFSAKTGSVNGWFKFEGKMQLSLLSAYTDINLLLTGGGYYIDDIRMIPDDANMKSFAYDLLTNRLMAELDENNFATFYEYDQEGVLIRVKKETERGILTVNEHRKSNAKHVQ
jgi:hypothetical protein